MEINDERIERECIGFLYREAELLDGWQFRDWLSLIASDIDYRAPVRTTRYLDAGSGFSHKAFYLKEDYDSLKMRVSRLDSEFAWAENPRTRTRRLVSNIRVGVDSNVDSHTDERRVASNMAVYCYRGDAPHPMILTCERKDILRRVDGRWNLARRIALLDTTVLGLESLSIFL
ncbi:aromatic-ring-hydroxylating dioxygenase subunit beta [Paraburkholderia xenovorans]